MTRRDGSVPSSMKGATSLSRRRADGTLVRAGSVQYGLDHAARQHLRERILAVELASSRRRRIRPIAEPVEVTVDAHGARDGVIRDPILRAVAGT